MGIFKKIKQFISSDTKTPKYNLTFYSDYPEQPYISPERDMDDWLQRVSMFPRSLVSRENMERLENGLLPGHIYMLHWHKKNKDKTVPVYFEYKYGIEFHTERNFLVTHGYLNPDYSLTSSGIDVVDKYQSIIEEHRFKGDEQRTAYYQAKAHIESKITKKIAPSRDLLYNYILGLEFEYLKDTKNAIALYEYNIKHCHDIQHPYDRLAILYRKKKDYDNEIRVMERAIEVFQRLDPEEYSNLDLLISQFEKRLESAKTLSTNELTPSTDTLRNNLLGAELEKVKNIDDAIKFYERNVDLKFEGNHPYDRLAIIYRKNKDYVNEIRVLEIAINVFENLVYSERADRVPKLNKFKERLASAKILNEKIDS